LKEREKGMPLLIDGKMQNVKVIVGPVTGDNLFLHSILGFTESFTANFPCRHCSLQRNSFQNTFFGIESAVQTVETCSTDVDRGVQNTGIKFSSPLNKLNYFHAANNFLQDVMHDLLEDVCKNDIILVTNHVIRAGFVTLDHLNGLVSNFSHGAHDIKNKPDALKASN
jgi:hypothetical protein